MHLIKDLNLWHDGLIFFKQRQNGISEDIINILQDFLHNRKQRVVLNGHCSSLVLLFLKDQSLDLYCSSYILTVYLMVLKVN